MPWSALCFVTIAAASSFLPLPLRALGVLLGLGGLTFLLARDRARLRSTHERERERTETLYTYRSLTRALGSAIGDEASSDRAHPRRVHELSAALGRRLRLPPAEQETIEAAAWVHDLGMIGVPSTIRSKPGPLEPAEVRRIRAHAEEGAAGLRAVHAPVALCEIVRHHHERWDGTGYPDGLRGDRIPRGARILALVDCYDALTSGRPYRIAVPREEALEYLRRESGRMFDPALVEPFAAALAEASAFPREPSAIDARDAARTGAADPEREHLPAELGRWIAALEGDSGTLGLVGIVVEGRPAGALASAVAGPGEHLFAAGDGRYVLLTPDGRPRVLASRALEVIRRFRDEAGVQVRCVQAAYPGDGTTAEALIEAIDRQLDADLAVPGAMFPRGRWSSAGIDEGSRPSQR